MSEELEIRATKAAASARGLLNGDCHELVYNIAPYSVTALAKKYDELAVLFSETRMQAQKLEDEIGAILADN